MRTDEPPDAVSLADVIRHTAAHLHYAREMGVRDVPRAPNPPAADHAGSRGRTGAPAARPAPERTADAALLTATSVDPADALARLHTDTIGDCRRCKLAGTRTNVVFGVGNPRAELVFVGEAPGAEEDARGIPFVGAAGKLLTKIIEAMGLQRDDVYIANIIKCRPPGNRNPQPDEIASCEPFLIAQLDAIRPKVICALGTFAAQTLLKNREPISRLRGRWHAYQGVPLMPTFHPAYLLRNPAEKKTVWADVQSVLTRLGRPIPPAGRAQGA